MIQRKQSVFLFFSGIISSIFALNAAKMYDLVVDWLSNPANGDSLATLAFFFSAFLSFVTILLFKNRKLQLKLGWLNIVLNFLILGFLLYYLLILPGESFSEKGIWIFAPIIPIALIYMANRLIRKDENLVKSIDRFR
ncbi:DUF4293 domain-containing protein [Vaginella massiliensis]|uniref:DUF4293 domain-containing protein n=1 Tax=Vaginella massiliensis TaxID=1816680 RepID=UPI000838E383|nr:DUF4293 domain-containing protein [Vaginella massiliensis]